jgi:hypothetical protein
VLASLAAAEKRLKALDLLLEWVHSTAFTTLSINSVDARGRTPLHYAAQLGRGTMCVKLVKAGAILTVVEEEAQKTPCELAGEAGFAELSAWLEAGAVFDDEVGLGVGAEAHQPGAVAPYSWFGNFGPAELDAERARRVRANQFLLTRSRTAH